MKSKNGMGLMETIVALGVIMTGLVSTIALAISNLNAARGSVLRYQAASLAREDLEIIRNMRDSNWLSAPPGGAWNGIVGTGAEVILRFDPTQPGQAPALISSATAPEFDAILRCGENGPYAQGSAFCTVPTPFTRRLVLRPISCVAAFPGTPQVCAENQMSDPAALEVTATVRWTESTQSRELILTETFYDWR